MFHHMLVYVSESTRDKDALAVARRFVERTGTRLTLLHLEPRYAKREDIEKAHAMLDGYAATLRAEGVTADTMVALGTDEEGMAKAARALRTDVILVVPEYRTVLEYLWYPRAATRMLSNMPAAMLIWPEEADPDKYLMTTGKVVLVPLDGSAQAERALPYAEAFAEELGWSIMLTHVVAMAPDGTLAPSELTYEAAVEYLERVRQRVASHTTRPVEVAAVTGQPAHELLNLTERLPAGLVMVTTHGQSSAGRFFIGVVATNLIRRSPVPVLIVPPAATVGEQVGDREGELLWQPGTPEPAGYR
jgi:nucleotide-binding universal stress UspA family protein